MLNPPNGTRRAAQNIETGDESILTHPPAPRQYQKAQSPPTPPHLSKLTHQPWTKENSLQLDWWLWYADLEFGGER
jgi:hypothetical protein